MKARLKRMVSLLLLTALAAGISSSSSAPGTVEELRIEPILVGGPAAQPSAIAVAEDKVYVFDDLTNRLFVVGDNGKLSETIGSIGPDPGQFFHPAGVALTSDSIVILDRGNERVQFLSRSGQFKTQFPVRGNVYGLAVDSKGRIYLNDPHLGHLVTVYDSHGNVIRALGDLTSVSSLYRTNDHSRDEQLKWQSNRVWITTDAEDNVYLAFLIAPVVRKYTPAGRLLFERALSGPGADSLIEIFWHARPGSRLLSSPIDGRQVDYITKAVAFDVGRQHLYVLAGLDELFELDTEGRQTRMFHLTGKQRGQLYKMGVREGRVFLTSVFVPRIYRGHISSGPNGK